MNTTYFLGAGASCGSIPMMADLTLRMQIFSFYIEGLMYDGNFNNSGDAEIFHKDLLDLLSTLDETLTVDFYARELASSSSLNAALKLNKLKRILTVYLAFEQCNKTNFDLISASFTTETEKKHGK